VTTFPGTYCPDCDQVVWHTPVPAASVAVAGSDGVLCGREAIAPGWGDRAVPGGRGEADDSPAETALRELRGEVDAQAWLRPRGLPERSTLASHEHILRTACERSSARVGGVRTTGQNYLNELATRRRVRSQ
jgi:ADP-ribose pyrophosphatase YjhB (NUDIX family)